MTTAQAMSEVFLTAFKALKKHERAEIVNLLLSEKEFREDLADIAMIERRRREGRVTLEEHLARRGGKR